MDAQKSGHEVRVRNVSFHRRGKAESGTLYLTKHHLIFQYQPSNVGGGRNVSSPQPSTSSSSTNLTKLASETAAHGHVSRVAESTLTPPKTNGKTPPKEVYVPYPMIHHCILRPSTALSAAQPVTRAQPDILVDDEELFPPTIGTNSYARPSTDSTRATPIRYNESSTLQSARPPAIRIRCKDFAIFALHFHATTAEKTPDEAARHVFYALRSKCCVSSIEDMYAFSFQPPTQETATGGQPYDARKEFARMGIRSKAPDGPGSAWRITDINNDYSYSATYPNIIVVPRVISDNVLKYSGGFRSKARIPALAYLHSNGGSITRASQPLVGVQGKRNPQDEKLVMAIFSSHTPKKLSPEHSPMQQAVKTSESSVSLNEHADILDEASTDEEAVNKRRVYGSTRRNYIVDARPKINMMANKAGGGGIEDIAYYSNGADAPLEKVFLSIANIHVMRSALDKVVEALGSSDYLDLAPNQDLLKKSGWLSHIANMLSGAEMVARVIGLGGSHVLIHCSDGWDRTAQISALAQLMLDPYYRTLSGFITLIQKDFLSFGHKFRHRQGTEGSEKWFEIENERITPARSTDGSDSNNNLQVFGTKALTGARTWFEKNKNTIFRQQSPSASNGERSRPTTPPPSNPFMHSSPTLNVKDEKHKMDEKEVAPIFHQFLDCVYQLLYQERTAFEFNERFLRRLLYQSYSGQYGEFLFNNEKERAQHQGHTPSVWANFLARKQEFTNPDFVLRTDDPLLFPRRRGYEREIDVRWWHILFGRKDEEMNIPQALAIDHINTYMSSVSLDNESAVNLSIGDTAGHASTIRSSRSTPALGVSVQADVVPNNAPADVFADVNTAQPSTASFQNENAASTISPNMHGVEQHDAPPSMLAMDFEEGDPLGVSPKPTSETTNPRGGLDFAAFARSNAFSER